MNGQNKRGSLVWGVIFTAAGIILLAQHLGYPVSFWKIAAKSWPILLVLAGLGKIFDYYRSRGALGLRFRDVGLVFVILLFGAVASLMARINLDPVTWRIPFWNKRNVPLIEWMKNSYTYEEEGSMAIPSGGPLVVDNAYGRVEITAGAVDDVKVRLKKVIYEDSEARAREVAQKMRLILQAEDQQLKVRTNYSELQGLGSRYAMDLFITVPKQTRCKVESRNGEVRVDGLTGDQEISSSGDAMALNDIRGAVRVKSRSKETNLSDITGNVEVACSGSRLTVDKVSGDVDVRNAFARSEIYNVEGKLSIRDRESTLRVERVQKDVTIEAPQSRIEVYNVKGDVKIDAVYNQPVRVEDVQANVTIASSNGLVAVRNIKGALTVQSTYGDLHVDEIQGPLTINAESSAVQAQEIKGATKIHTTLKDVVINTVEGQTTISNKYGAVTLATGTKLPSSLDIINQSGRIDLVLPEDSSFKIQARARLGGVVSQFEGPNLFVATDGDGTIKGLYGNGGSTINLETSYNTISLRKGTEVHVRRGKSPKTSKPPILKPRRHRGRQEILIGQSSRGWLSGLPALVRESLDGVGEGREIKFSRERSPALCLRRWVW